MTGQVYIALFVGLAAAMEDLARRRISNWIPAVAFVAGLAWMIWHSGWRGGLSSLGGTAAGFAVFLVFYWLGGMGGGDVKLMAGFGAVLGWDKLWVAAYLTALVGAALAVAWMAGNAVKNRWRQWRSGVAPQRVEAIPYAPAITLGVWLALVPPQL